MTSATILRADDLPRWSRYAVMMRDVGHDGRARGDGILTQLELEAYIDRLHDERHRLLSSHASTRTVDVRLRDSEQMLHDMRSAGAEGLSYLPEDVVAANLDPRLTMRVVEMLMKDDEDKSGRVTQSVLDRARGRYMQLEGRSMPELNSQQRALEDIRHIAGALGLR